MRRKGFTLVELLAVIIILALLIVITSLSVITLLNRTKKEAFKTNVMNMIEEAKDSYVADSFNSSEKEFIYTNADIEESKQIVNDKGYNYKIKLYEENGSLKGYYMVDNNDNYSTRGEIPYDKIIVNEKDGNISDFAFTDKGIISVNDVDFYKNLECSQDLKDRGYVTYEDFLAVGDGITNDGTAIYYAHECANKLNVPIKSLKKTYYISHMPTINNSVASIKIKTDVDWNNATIIIDDRDLSRKEEVKNLFLVSPISIAYGKKKDLNYNSSTTVVTELLEFIQQKNSISEYFHVGLRNTTDKIYRSNGDNDGIFQSLDKYDFFKIDKLGNVINKIRYNYGDDTYVYIYDVPNEQLRLENVNLKTLSKSCIVGNKISCSTTERNVAVQRSNTLINNLNHYVIDNGDPDSYSGFLYISNASDVVVKNSNFRAHIGAKSGYTGSTTSYDIQIGNSSNILFENIGYTCNENETLKECHFNNIIDKLHTGVTGNNNIKNFTLNNVMFNRIDSHQPSMNVNISNSIIGYYGVHMTGEGEINIKNSSYDQSDRILYLRADYGGTWNGTANINNIYFNTRDYKGSYPTNPRIFIYATTNTFNVANGGFGYKLYIPKVNASNVFYDEKNLVSSYYEYNKKNGKSYDTSKSPGIILVQNYLYNNLDKAKKASDPSTFVGNLNFYNIRSVTFDKIIFSGIFGGNKYGNYTTMKNGNLTTSEIWGVSGWNREYLFTNTEPININVDMSSAINRNYTHYYKDTYYEDGVAKSGNNAVEIIKNSTSHPYCVINVKEQKLDDWYEEEILNVTLDVPSGYNIVDYGLSYNTNTYNNTFNMIIPKSKSGVFNIYGFIKDDNGNRYDCIKLIKKL